MDRTDQTGAAREQGEPREGVATGRLPANSCALRRGGESVATDNMILTYRVRLQPTRQQRRALESITEQQRQLYNAALEERIGAYAKGVTINENAQSKSLTIIRQDDETFASVQRRIQRGTLKRLDRAYQGFFRRAKQGAGASSGFPKFRARASNAGLQSLTGFGFDGFGFDAPAQIKFDGRRLRFSGMCGGLRVSKQDMARVPPMTPDTWKGVHFKRTHAGWQVTFQVVTPIAVDRAGCGRGDVGVDWGTSVLAALSTGQIEPNPRPREALSSELWLHERRVARSQRGSKRRLKARYQKQRVERQIANRRRNRLDKLSKKLVTHYALVAAEDIQVSKMMHAERPGETLPQFVKTRRNREALDAAPYLLRQMLAYKATRAAATLALVDAKNTTQECFWCGGLHFKELTDAVHTCTRPGLYFGKTVPRKVNAARVILKKALSSIAKGDDDGGGRAPAAGGKPSKRSTGSVRPMNTPGILTGAAGGSRSGQAGTPQSSFAGDGDCPPGSRPPSQKISSAQTKGALDPRLRRQAPGPPGVGKEKPPAGW